MKDIISEQQFLLRQPNYPQKTSSDKFYYRLTNRLADICRREGLLSDWPDVAIGRAMLGIVGYFQDILTDSGIFRSFTEEHNRLYGRRLPFYPIDDNYIQHELNLQDVNFMLWYTLALYSDDRRELYPLDADLHKAAVRIHAELDRLYEDEDTPIPEDYHISRGLELGNPEEADEVFRFGHWLFMHCYLMTPAFAMTLSEILAQPELDGGKNIEALQGALEDAMTEVPTGPLALYLREWLFLIIDGKMPKEQQQPFDASSEYHPYYTKFVEYAGGSPIAFFPTYNELNHFFIEALGWDNTENLPNLKNSGNFVCMVNPQKGMLVAKDIAKCIKMDGNPCYDQEFARKHAISLLTMRGKCPADLLHYLFEKNAIPDASFPGTNDTQLVKNNRDFIARCYLQLYYRGD